nr:MAG TPA: hypothetical protein [Caudoviricetes sp.]
MTLFPNFPALCFIFSFSPAFTAIKSRSYIFALYLFFARVADVPMLSPPAAHILTFCSYCRKYIYLIY